MSSSLFLRARVRALFISLFCVTFLGIASLWAANQKATTRSDHAARRNSSTSLFLTDKGGVTPDANTIVVNSTADVANGSDGLCTLREAITAANNNAASGAAAGECAAGSSSGADTINIAVTGTINLTSALPNITTSLNITGPGSSQMTVQRNTSGSYRIFTVTSGTVAITGLTVTNGHAPDGVSAPGSNGGGILNSATLTLSDVAVTANAAGTGGNGGGIANAGTMTMTNCAVTGNHSGEGSGGGGGIYNTQTLTITGGEISANSAGSSAGGPGGGISSSGTLTLTGVRISSNTAADNTGGGGGGNGGGISASGVLALTNVVVDGNRGGSVVGPFSNVVGGGGGGIFCAGTATISNSTVSGNNSGAGRDEALGGDGGGIYAGGSVVISNSTISGNLGNEGGGVGAFGTSLRLVNSTLSGNTGRFGGGLYSPSNPGTTAVLTNCTVTANVSSIGGNGIGLNNGNAIVTARNTIIARNGTTPGDSRDLNGSFTSQGHNFIGVAPGSNGFTDGVNGDQAGGAIGIDPHLGPLANNGGATMTHALLSNSTALDAGDDCVAQASHCSEATLPQLLTDQRGAGFSRTVDGPDGDTTATVDIGAYEMQTRLADLPTTSTNEDTQIVIPFDGGDTSTITSVTATSSDGAVVPNDAAHLSVAINGSTGVVTINPAPNANGQLNITVTVNRTGGPESATFILTVVAVNDAPSFTKGPDQIVNEDAGPQTVNNWATNISAGPNEAGQALHFSVIGNTNSNLLSEVGMTSSGTLLYTPAANANGSSTITLMLQDDGGSANGGVDNSIQQFTITVNPVNDAPSFTKGADQTVNEDSGARTFANWATNISAGPNESGQTVSFTLTNDNNALFSTQPAVGSTGTLTFTPAVNANGSATISVVIKDNGGTANGGVDTSAVQTFTITVNAVNDTPSFTKGANQTVNEDAGAQTVANWASNISAGPADEAGQTLTFQITANTNTALFSAGPAVSSTGTLTYTPAANANGSATITINIQDNGGTVNGGSDTSASQSFTITVNAVNDVPSFTKGADQTVNNNAGAQTVANWATSISPGPANESGQTLTFQVTGNTNPGLFTAGPAVSSTGTLTYTPSTSGGGSATITINLKDNGGTANGGVDTSASQTFTITVTPVGGFVNFASSSSSTTENSGSTTVNVTRSGDTSRVVTVNYATNADAGVPCSTANGVASPKCDFTAALGTLNFAAGETSKPITILLSQDSFVEGPETITLTLSSPTGGAALGTPGSMTVTIADDATEPPTNIIDDANMFVRMHYHDFLNREGDQSGLDFWTGQMTNCGSSDLTVCRVNVSGAFFLSIEFQQTGYLVERMYRTAYGQATASSTLGGSHAVLVPIVRANEFLTDTQRIGRGVVVLQPGWEQVLENNKQAYALEFVQTSRFITALPTSRTPTQFVDQLNQNAGMVLSPSERTAAINAFGIAADTTNVNARAQVLRQIAEDQDLYNAEFNRAFVLTEFFGYLRRNPNDLPDSDYTGYEFWLSKLNQF
ncbi:MAG TPA: hypothetical protein DC054_10225, partial [Blastocatellia bacterium]|nr:hypothetical protein [Blastocatellia bacterium]